MKNKLILTIIILSVLAGVFFFSRFLLPSERGGREGFNNGDLSAQAAPAANRTGLVLDLNFGNNNGAAAPTVYDTSGNGRNATSTAATAPTCNNKFCSFASKFMTANATNAFNSANISIAMKFSPVFAANDGAAHDLLDTTNLQRTQILKWSDNNIYLYAGATTLIATFSLANYQPYWKVGKENVFIIVATSGNNKVWLNGNKLTNDQGDAVAWTAQNPSTVYVGSQYGLIQFFNGNISYLKVWNRLLTNDEVANLSGNMQSAGTLPSRSSGTTAGGKLVGYWTMDTQDMSTTGATLYDKSGQNNNGTVSGTTTSTGRIGQARGFNNDSYINLGDSSIFQAANITVSSWFKTSATQGRILRKGPGGYVLEVGDFNGICGGSNGKVEFWIYSGQFLCAKTANTYNDGNWHHALGSFNGSSVKLYVDGVLKDTNNTVATISYFAGNVGIGGDTAGGSPLFNGSLDDVRVYNYALSAQEISNLYNASAKSYSSAPSRTGLVGWWSMDTQDMSATGATMYDKSGQNNNGTVTGTTTSTGQIGQARSFNGTSDYINCGTASSLSVNTGSFSVWFKAGATQNNNARIMEIGAASDRVGFYIEGTIKALAFYPVKASAPLWAPTTVSPVNDNRWHHAAGTWSASGGTFYLDGNLVSSSVSNLTLSLPANPTCYIGEYVGGGSYYFAGLIDDARIYNRALSAQEVGNLYNSSRKVYMK